MTADMNTDLFSELRRHANGAHEHKARVNMVLDSVTNVLKAHRAKATSNGSNKPPSAVEYFGAIMTTIDSDVTCSYTSELIYLLAFVLPNVPEAVLKVKFVQIFEFINNLLVSDADIGGGASYKSLISCLGCLIHALGYDSATLQQKAVSKAFKLLLTFTIDRKAKARKEAHRVLVKLLELHNANNSSVLGSKASKFCVSVMKNAYKDTDDATQSLQLLALLRSVLPVLPPSSALDISKSLLRLLHSKNTLLSVGCLGTLCSYITDDLTVISAKSLTDLLTSILSEPIPVTLSHAAGEYSRLMAASLVKLNAAEVGSTYVLKCLPRCVEVLISYFSSHDRALTKSVQIALKEIFLVCMDKKFIVSSDSEVSSVIESLRSVIGYKFTHSWNALVEPFCALYMSLSKCIEVLKDDQKKSIYVLTLSLVEFYESGVDNNEEYIKHVFYVLGVIVDNMGPEIFLDVVSLSSKDSKNFVHVRRNWVLPLLESHSKNYLNGLSLQYFGTNILSLIKSHEAAAEEEMSLDRKSAKDHLSKALKLWKLLPQWSCRALDTAQVFASMANTLGNAASNTKIPELSEVISRTLTKLIRSNLEALSDGNELNETNATVDELPSTFNRVMEDDELDSDMDEDIESDLLAGESKVTDVHSNDVKIDTGKLNVLSTVAAGNLEVIKPFAPKFLPLLFHLYDRAHGTWLDPPSAAPHTGFSASGSASAGAAILDAIATYVSIASYDTIHQLFQTLIKKLLAAITEMGVDGVSGSGESRRTAVVLMGLLSAIIKPLSLTDVSLVYRVVEPTISSGNFSLLQQRSYSVLLAICATQQQWVSKNVLSITGLLRNSLLTVTSSAKKSRLRSLVYVIKAVDESNPENLALMPELLGEVILCLKESNKRAREAAFDLLVVMSEKMQSAGKLNHNVENGPSLQEFVKMVLAGLAAKTPHMRSATVLALARIIFQYRETESVLELIPTILKLVLMLLHEKSREVIKSVLGFIKVAIGSAAKEIVFPFLGDICGGLLEWSGDTKNRFRTKIRHILERLVRKFGFEEVKNNIPEKDMKLMSHIRRTNDRKLRKKEQVKSSRSINNNNDNHVNTVSEAQEEDNDEDMLSNSDGDEDDRDESEWIAKARSNISNSGGWLRNDSSDNPLDLLDSHRTATGLSSVDPSRLRGNGVNNGDGNSDDDIALDLEGRLIIKDDEPIPDDVTAILKRKAMAAASVLNKTGGTKRGRGNDGGDRDDYASRKRRAQGQPKSSKAHSGAEFKAKRAGGDMQKTTQQPYAYLPLDHRFLNRKKKRDAPRQYSGIVQSGKGNKNTKLNKKNRNVLKY